MRARIRLVLGLFRLSRDPNIPRLDLQLIRQFWYLTRLYWFRPQAWPSWLAILILTAWTFGTTESMAYMAKLGGDKLGALAKNDEVSYFRLVFQAALLSQGMSLLRLVFDFPERLLDLHWKRWMTRHFVHRYLSYKAYYRIQRDRLVDNPDERIAEDIKSFVDFPLRLFLGVMRTVSTLAVFGPILWGYQPRLILFCFLWALFDSAVTLAFNRSTLNLGFERRKLEGNFRAALVRAGASAESIGFSRGEEAEQFEIYRRFDQVFSNDLRSFAWSTVISVCRSLLYLLDTLVPTYLLAPLYFRAQIDMSGLTQLQAAWSRVEYTFGFFGQESSSLAFEGAIISRLYSLHQACEASPDPTTIGQQIQMRHLDVGDPAGQHLLVERLNLSIQPNERWLVVGPTGSGKTSLLRVLAGLWSPQGGEVTTLSPQRISYLPQRPHLRAGSLLHQVAYPAATEEDTPQTIRILLERVGLGYLEERFRGLDTVLDWGSVLSPGEQQRLAFARLLRQRPDFAVLDEATAAIDPEGEQLMYRLLRETGCGYLSVAHRPGVAEFHESTLELTGRGSWRVSHHAEGWFDAHRLIE